jgi:hypothetical protein
MYYSVRFGFEPISNATHGQQVLRTLGVVFYIPAQADDEIVDGTSVSVFAKIPDLLEN